MAILVKPTPHKAGSHGPNPPRPSTDATQAVDLFSHCDHLILLNAMECHLSLADLVPKGVSILVPLASHAPILASHFMCKRYPSSWNQGRHRRPMPNIRPFA